MGYFCHSNRHNLGYKLTKYAKLHFLESPQKSLKHANIHINRATHFKKQLLKKLKNCVVFGDSFFKMKIANILNFWQIKYLGKGLLYIRYRCQVLLKLRAIEVAIHCIEYRLDQLNNKHTKIIVISKLQFFESRYQKKCLVKV